MNTKINAYLNFNGRCREAMTFYMECLGGDVTFQTVADSPMAVQLPSADAQRILHSSLLSDQIILMASDMMGDGLIKGNNVTLCMNAESEEEIHQAFEKLSRGATIRTPLHQSFWGATYGELTDRYGVHWMFNYTKPKK
jgi:PhnB protein